MKITRIPPAPVAPDFQLTLSVEEMRVLRDSLDGSLTVFQSQRIALATQVQEALEQK